MFDGEKGKEKKSTIKTFVNNVEHSQSLALIVCFLGSGTRARPWLKDHREREQKVNLHSEGEREGEKLN